MSIPAGKVGLGNRPVGWKPDTGRTGHAPSRTSPGLAASDPVRVLVRDHWRIDRGGETAFEANQGRGWS